MKHLWKVVMQSSDGQTHQIERAYGWSPEKDFISSESIARAAAAEETVRHGGTRGAWVKEFAGISAELVKS